ncbi:hypothetical protein E2C01_080578 [Portunus trituberculatus]|uniref:Uncharacterized protein n=1 Tax=Portunus trituberculatus TaxID=210409 RepID=A0A5B7IZZ2_PORTR|nr:hypothetical protein [Portunus trituberculatus]
MHSQTQPGRHLLAANLNKKTRHSSFSVGISRRPRVGAKSIFVTLHKAKEDGAVAASRATEKQEKEKEGEEEEKEEEEEEEEEEG